ncbi:barstar family protein [Streptomyces sp. NPDC001514]
MLAIDVSAAADERGLHVVLAEALHFPGFYGMHWAAFWDAITGLVRIPDHLRFVGWAQLSDRVPSGAAVLRQALDRYRQQRRPQSSPSTASAVSAPRCGLRVGGSLRSPRLVIRGSCAVAGRLRSRRLLYATAVKMRADHRLRSSINGPRESRMHGRRSRRGLGAAAVCCR